MVDETSYVDGYNTAIKELSELIDEREQMDVRYDQIDARTEVVRRAAVALARLAGKRPWEEHPEWFPAVESSATIGLTSAVRRVLQTNEKGFFSPVSVRDGLNGVGYELKSKNILPSIHNVLKRLDTAGQVQTEDRNGRTWYRWKGPIPPEDRVAGAFQDVFNLAEKLREYPSRAGSAPPKLTYTAPGTSYGIERPRKPASKPRLPVFKAPDEKKD